MKEERNTTMAFLQSVLRCIIPFVVWAQVIGTAAAYQNVNGGELAQCSTAGMAKTGFTRDGSCVDANNDAGSHHICIDLSSTTGGNFCTVTGQSDWCSSEMPCQDDEESECKVKNWCVCQWAFASYIKNAGGCDNIQTLKCSAINKSAIDAYKTRKDSEPDIQAAYDCIEKRCGISDASRMLRHK